MTRGIQRIARLYPWSALWVLTAVAMILIVHGSWATVTVVSLLVLVVTYHSIHREHNDKTGGHDDRSD